jgi:hypothetical protein
MSANQKAQDHLLLVMDAVSDQERRSQLKRRESALGRWPLGDPPQGQPAV